MAAKQHEDFGEKIGGARKDLWRKRGLLADDLDHMNEREADKYVRKDNIWKKNNYQAMIDSGVPFDVVYFIKKVRDSLNPAPFYLRMDDTPEKRLARQKQYIDTIREIQQAVVGVTTKADALKVFERYMVDGAGYFEKKSPGAGPAPYYATATPKGRANPFITWELTKAMLFKSERDFEIKITDKAQREQFGVAKDKRRPQGYEIRFNDGKHTWSVGDEWKPGTYFVERNNRILKTNLATREEALRWAQNDAKDRGNGGKIKLVPPQLEHINRDGPDYRHGRNADGQWYLDAFGFKGGEFGNWMSPLDRQASLNYGFDALKDLADALCISDWDISYGGHLSIAFGARGVGRFAAHYEPMRQVINLTKMRGAGSLAHEWWHGLDDYLGARFSAGGYLSDNPRKFPLFAELIQTIKYKPQTVEQAVQSNAAADKRTRKNAESWLSSIFSYSIDKAGNEVKARYETLKQPFFRGEEGSVEKLSLFKKELFGHVIRKQERDTLLAFERLFRSAAERTEPTIGSVKTDYYRASIEMGKACQKENNYWDSAVEMTARAFATYVMDKLERRSDYLVGHAECAVALTADRNGNPEVIRAFPQGEERKAINAVFDKLIAELKLQNIFSHDARISPTVILAPAVSTLVNVAASVDESRGYGTDVHGQLSFLDYDGISGYMEDMEDEEDMEL